MTEEKKERSSEIRAALSLAREWSDELHVCDQKEMSDFILRTVAEVEAKWLAVVSSEEAEDAFWEQVLANIEELFLTVIRKRLETRNIVEAYTMVRSLLRFLGHYMECLGVEVPPEEEEAAAEVAAEVEPEVELEERPWEELGITEEMWNRPLREVLEDGEELNKHTKSEVSAILIKLAVQLGVPSRQVRAGPALEKLNEKGWEPGFIRNLGEGRFAFLRRKLSGAGYPVPPERPKGLPRGRPYEVRGGLVSK